MMQSARDEEYMQAALACAEVALERGEVPVGCILVDRSSGEIVASGENDTNRTCNATRHAEFVAVERLRAKYDGNVDAFGRALSECCDLYVTCEPCIMCAALLRTHGVKRIVFGCRNPIFGGCGTVLSVHNDAYASLPASEIVEGVLEGEAISLLQQFYERGNPRTGGAGKR